jgi:uncharacterized protein involved in exopolysaccharide biosynthesis
LTFTPNQFSDGEKTCAPWFGKLAGFFPDFGRASMSESSREPTVTAEDDISVLDILSTIVENGRWVIGAAVAGLVIALVVALTRERSFEATALMASSSPAGPESQLAGLANQFGLGNMVPSRTGGLSATPDLIVEIGESSVLLERLLDDTVTVDGASGPRTFLELVTPKEGGVANSVSLARRKRGVEALRRHISLEKTKPNSLIAISATSPSPQLSLAIARAVVDELNQFMLELGRSQASEEVKSVRRRMAERDSDLRLAEDRLATFLSANREYRSSPQLTFEYERLQRAVTLHQTVLVGLTQANEEASLREVRDTPILVTIESPRLPLEAQPRKRIQTMKLGLASGLLVGIPLALVVAGLKRSRQSGNPRWTRLETAVRRLIGRPARQRAP